MGDRAWALYLWVHVAGQWHQRQGSGESLGDLMARLDWVDEPFSLFTETSDQCGKPLDVWHVYIPPYFILAGTNPNFQRVRRFARGIRLRDRVVRSPRRQARFSRRVTRTKYAAGSTSSISLSSCPITAVSAPHAGHWHNSGGHAMVSVTRRREAENFWRPGCAFAFGLPCTVSGAGAGNGLRPASASTSSTVTRGSNL